MKIAFTGSSGTGKTTLAKWISEKYGLEFCPVGARSTAAKLGFKFPYDVDRASEGIYLNNVEKYGPEEAASLAMTYFDSSEIDSGKKTCRGLFQKQLLEDKIAWEASHKHFVTDRTLIDNFAYAGFHDPMAVDYNDLVRVREITETDPYTFTFWTPVDVFIDIGSDPARKDSKGYHAMFDIFLQGFLSAWGLEEDVIELSMEGIEARKEFIAHILDQQDIDLDLEGEE